MADKSGCFTKKYYSHFCFCLPVKSGALIITIVWMITGVALTAVFLDIYFKNKVDNIFGHVHNLSIVLAILSLIITMLAGYGLSVLFFRKSPDRIRLYTHLSWFYMVFVWIVVSIGTLIAFLTKRNNFVNYCLNNIATEDMCKQFATKSILRLAVGISITTICNIYFATILQVCHNRLCQNYPELIRKRSQRQTPRRPIKNDKQKVVSSLWSGRHFWEKKLFDIDSDSNGLNKSNRSGITDEETDGNYIISEADVSEAGDAFETYKMTRIKSDQETRENNEDNEDEDNEEEDNEDEDSEDEDNEDEANSQTQQDTDSTIVQDPDPYVYSNLFQYRYKK
uniref:Uncharacterized protein n=1 Tax=Anthurium amnicola TaxID=1678845 RepID=A0A1D1Y4W1_9ARAE